IAVVGEEVAECAHDENPDNGERHELNRGAVARDQAFVHQRFHERREARRGGRQDQHAENGGERHPFIRPRVSEDAPVEREIRTKRRARSRVRAHGRDSGGCWVAKVRCVIPSRRATSITRTTASCGVFASAWMTIGRSLSPPASRAMALRSTSDVALSNCWLLM